MPQHWSKPTARDLLLRMFEILNKGEYDGLADIADPDIRIEWPQSRERVRGLPNMKAIFSHYPGGPIAPDTNRMEFIEGDTDQYVLTPMFTAVRAEGSGDRATSTVMTRYPDGSDWYIISIAEAHDGKLTRVTSYFAPTYEAPEWRSQWVEKAAEE